MKIVNFFVGGAFFVGAFEKPPHPQTFWVRGLFDRLGKSLPRSIVGGKKFALCMLTEQ
jgi:hypothetical protein